MLRSPRTASAQRFHVRFWLELGLCASLWLIAGLLKAGLDVPGGIPFVVAGLVSACWGLFRQWRTGDPEQRDAVEAYRSSARSWHERAGGR